MQRKFSGYGRRCGSKRQPTRLGVNYTSSLCNLSVLGVSGAVVSHIPITTETQSTRRLHRELLSFFEPCLVLLLFERKSTLRSNDVFLHRLASLVGLARADGAINLPV